MTGSFHGASRSLPADMANAQGGHLGEMDTAAPRRNTSRKLAVPTILG